MQLLLSIQEDVTYIKENVSQTTKEMTPAMMQKIVESMCQASASRFLFNFGPLHFENQFSELKSSVEKLGVTWTAELRATFRAKVSSIETYQIKHYFIIVS